MRKVIFPMLLVMGSGMIVGCETTSPNSPAQQVAMRDEARASLERMEAQDPGLTNLVNNSYGYAIFPEIGSAAVGIGGASGKGFVYHNGQRAGMVKMNQASVGLDLGGDTYAELIIFQDEHAYNRMVNNSIEFSGDASATIVKAGAAAAKQFADGVQVYILPKGGLKAGVALAGQKFHFTPMTESRQTETNYNR